jgi:hypothetical protein
VTAGPDKAHGTSSHQSSGGQVFTPERVPDTTTSSGVMNVKLVEVDGRMKLVYERGPAWGQRSEREDSGPSTSVVSPWMSNLLGLCPGCGGDKTRPPRRGCLSVTYHHDS